MSFDKSLSAKNTGTRSGRVEFIVLHDTNGNGGPGDAKYLANDPDKRGISVDFCVTKDGTMFQLNHDLKNRCTFHAGRHTRFRGRTNGGVNQHSIGIEIAQKADMKGLDPAYPDVQVAAVAEVCRYLCQEFRLEKTDITTHAKIITDGTRSDPRNFNWELFWKLFNNQGGEVGSRVDTQRYHIVRAGDTLYSLAKKYTTTVEQIKALNSMNTPSNVITQGQDLLVKE